MLRRQGPITTVPDPPKPPATFAKSVGPTSGTASKRQSTIGGVSSAGPVRRPSGEKERAIAIQSSDKDNGSATQVLAMEKELEKMRREVSLSFQC
jgi:hypothetical protein